MELVSLHMTVFSKRITFFIIVFFFFSYAVNLPCSNWRFCCTLINLVLDYSRIHFVSELAEMAHSVRKC